MNHDVFVFLAGSAVGAVCAGLFVHLGEGRDRKVLEEQVQEALRAAARADEAAIRATSRTARADEAAIRATSRTDISRVNGHVHGHDSASLPEPHKEDEQDRIVAMRGEESLPDRTHAGSKNPHTPGRDPRSATHTSVETGDSSPEVEPRSVRTVLAERLGRHGLDEMPVISRGTERTGAFDEIALRLRPAHAPMNGMSDPHIRATIIDRRVPRFDESPYPGATVGLVHEEDEFVRAMHAMEETLSTPVGDTVEPTAGVRGETPTFSDASSYVDYLVEDEMRRNRSEAGRRYSRQHLTVFEGTGDLAAARRALASRARHLAPMSREA